MKKTKIFVIVSQWDELDIMLIDGGIASIHFNEERFLTTYYQDRATIEQLRTNTLWDSESHLMECNQYTKDWDENIQLITQEMIYDACEWLHPMGFQRETSEIIFADYRDVATAMEQELVKISKEEYNKQSDAEYVKLEEEEDKIKAELQGVQSDEQESEIHSRLHVIYCQMKQLASEKREYNSDNEE